MVIVGGKGGVGKTTVSAALARAAADRGMSVLVVAVDGRNDLASLFGAPPLGYDEAVISPGGTARGEIRGRVITPDEALVDYLEDHGLGRVSRRFAESGAVDLIATTTPGVKDLLVLGKIKQLERAGAADLIVLDAPAAGHAVTFLLAARSLQEIITTGPIRTQADEVLAMLGDGRRCQVLLVALPEETPVNEAADTAFLLEDRVGVRLAPVVVNAVVEAGPALRTGAAEAAAEVGIPLSGEDARSLDDAAAFVRARARLHEAQCARLAERLPLDQIRLPWRPVARLGPDDVAALAGALLRQPVGA